MGPARADDAEPAAPEDIVFADPTAGSVRLIMNDPLSRGRPTDSCTLPVCTSLLALIEGAEERIDFAIYGLRNQSALLGALQLAKERGVRIRGVVDRTIDGSTYYSGTETLIGLLGDVRDDLAVDRITAENTPVFDPDEAMCFRPAPEGFAGPLQCVGYDLGSSCIVAAHASREPFAFEGDIMHDKFVVVDGRKVWTGSTNLSDSGTGGYNANLAVVIDDPRVARWYEQEMDNLWEGRFHGLKTPWERLPVQVGDTLVEAAFSPQDDPLDNVVRPLIREAREHIDVAVFFLTHKLVTRELIAAHRRGVKVRVIIDATGAGNGYTKHELLRAAGIPVKVESWGGKMHMKSAMIDGEVVIAGSMNWTAAGQNGNDENTLVLHSARLAREYEASFEQMWTSIPDRWLEGRPDPESLDSGTACTDRADDDFDGLIDAGDPGCGPNPPALDPLPPWKFAMKAEGYGLIKGNISESGERLYYVPGQQWYDEVRITPSAGEAFFCSDEDARDAGFRRAPD